MSFSTAYYDAIKSPKPCSLKGIPSSARETAKVTSGHKRTLTEFMDMVKDVDENRKGLTKWEIDFIAGFIDKPPKGFSEKQWEIVERIKDQKVK